MKDNKLLLKVLQNKANKEEVKTFFEECEKNNELKEEYLKLKNLWTLSVNEASPNKKQNFEQFWKKANKQSKFKLRKLYVEVARYAAIVIISISIGFLLYQNIRPKSEQGIVQTFTSEKGSVSSIKLADGSVIWLNTGSEIVFEKKAKGMLYAKLTGEAFFDIKHDPNREFVVDVNDFQIRDLGTTFNVKAYEDDNSIIATLVEGKIAVNEYNGNPIAELIPNERFVFTKSNRKFAVEKLDVRLVSAWTEGKFVFIDKTLGEICKELERWYDVKISINNEELKNEKFTSVIKRSTSIEEMLELLKVTAGIKYQITNMNNAPDVIRLN